MKELSKEENEYYHANSLGLNNCGSIIACLDMLKDYVIFSSKKEGEEKEESEEDFLKNFIEKNEHGDSKYNYFTDEKKVEIVRKLKCVLKEIVLFLEENLSKKEKEDLYRRVSEDIYEYNNSQAEIERQVPYLELPTVTVMGLLKEKGLLRVVEEFYEKKYEKLENKDYLRIGHEFGIVARFLLMEIENINNK